MSIISLLACKGTSICRKFSSLRQRANFWGRLAAPLLQIFRSADRATKLGDSLKISAVASAVVAVGLVCSACSPRPRSLIGAHNFLTLEV